MNIEILTAYIAAWMWFLIGLLFLTSSTILLVLGNYPLMVGFFMVFIGCTFKAMERKKEVEKDG